MRYVVYVESKPAGFEAYVPDLPGCTASGDTREEALDRIRESIAAYDQGLRAARKNMRSKHSPSELVPVNLA
jgi:predicted RNase H-like HicB family nuclease